MASYGEGFAQGMHSGSSLVNGIFNMKNQNDRQDREKTLFDQSQTDREQKGQLFKAYQDQYDQVQGIKELGVRNAEQQGLMEQFTNASAGDMTHFIMQNFQANGGKVNDQTYLLASGIGDTLFKTKNEVQKTEQANKLFNLQVQEHQRKLTQPLSNEGKIATDFNMPLTPESISRNPTLFGRADSATANMKDFKFAQQNGFKGDFNEFVTSSKDTKPSDVKAYEYAQKNNGFKGTFVEFKNATKEIPDTPTLLSKLYAERDTLPEEDPKRVVYDAKIKLVSEGRESEATQLVMALNGLSGQQPTQPKPQGKTVVRTGVVDGKKVIQYSDGTTAYAQ